VGPRAGLDTEVRRKILSPLSGIDPRSPGRPAPSQTLHRLSCATHLGFITPGDLLYFTITNRDALRHTVRISAIGICGDIKHNDFLTYFR
jgi:hypothetical protein